MRGAARGGQRRRAGAAGAWLAALAIAGGAPSARAEDPANPAPPNVNLDRLLQLPKGTEFDVERRGNATRSEWRARFKTARGDLEKAKDAKAKAQAKLEEAAADSPWRMSGLPGAAQNAAESTENYQLVQEVKRQTEEVDRCEKKLRDLEVQANLAAVPADWRQEPAAPAR